MSKHARVLDKDEQRSQAYAEMTEDEKVSDKTRDLHMELYAKIDGLEPWQKRLLIHSALSRIADGVSGEPRTSQELAVIGAITQVGGYAMERLREEEGENDTDDSDAVGEVWKTLRATMASVFEDAMPPEVRDEAQATIARIKERIAAGEDPEAVLADEQAKNPFKRPVEAAKAEPEDDSSWRGGMYL